MYISIMAGATTEDTEGILFHVMLSSIINGIFENIDRTDFIFFLSLGGIQKTVTSNSQEAQSVSMSILSLV